MSKQYGFFTTIANSPMHNQMSFIASSTSAGHMSRGEMQGMDLYMYENNFRRSISLFSVRSLIKSSWIYKDNSYISPLVKDMGK
jgi:hypothetical protein